MPGVPELTPTEFCARWSAAERGKSVVLLDVREHDELAAAAVAEARHIPMREIPARIAELGPQDARIVVHCHHGGRSLRVASWLRQQGFDQAQSMSGGIERWATEIDSGVPRY